MSDTCGDDTDHKITQEGWAMFFEVYGFNDEGEFGIVDVEERGPCKTKNTLKCSCGRNFRKEKTAAEHLRTARAVTDGGQDDE